MSIDIVSYNIHKGFSYFNQRMIIHELRERLIRLNPDIVLLQEVHGDQAQHAARFGDWPSMPQYEFLAEANWTDVAYGQNAVYEHGDHGNAILSRFPILSAVNQDISYHPFESRGLLHCEIAVPESRLAVHCINVHLGLFEGGRQWQLTALCDRIRTLVPPRAPLIIAGDFNDWRHRANRVLYERLGVHEVFEQARGRSARTYPAVLPMLQLDRIYIRGFIVERTEVHNVYPRSRLSDHAALSARLRCERA
jgi:endonuclease/exonuclease/phosphatase family metal-dependent hydrolase